MIMAYSLRCIKTILQNKIHNQTNPSEVLHSKVWEHETIVGMKKIQDASVEI